MSYATHDHRWEPDEGPIFEDGAAIFVETCTWAETRGSYHSEKHDEVFYDEGPTCGEERSYRLDASYIWIDNEGHPIPEDQRKWSPKIEEAMEEVEQAAFPHGEDVDIIDIEPHPDGVVRITYKDYEVVYEG